MDRLGGSPADFFLGGRDDDDSRSDAEGKGDWPQVPPRNELGSGQVRSRTNGDRGPPSRPAKRRIASGPSSSIPMIVARIPTTERRSVSVGEHEAADSRHDQHRGDDCRVMRGLRARRSCREGASLGRARQPALATRRLLSHRGPPRRRSWRAVPGEAEPVEAKVERGLECGRNPEPECETGDRSDQCTDPADDCAVREQHESNVLLGRADAASMPSWRSRRWAMTAKPAVATSEASNMKTVATANIASSGAGWYSPRIWVATGADWSFCAP